jgi:uncharacterized protein (TIGR02145 family)
MRTRFFLISTLFLGVSINTAAQLSGCTYPQACNFSADATIDDGSCFFAAIGFDCEGQCLDNNENGICDFDEVYGCTYINALNYNQLATSDNGTCTFTCAGDFDNNAIVNASDLLSFLVAFGNQCGVIGCTSLEAINYNPEADLDNGSCIFYGELTDGEGNTYNTVVIGDQEWMAENLRVTTYANGDPITNGQLVASWTGLGTTGGYAVYNDDPELEAVYGLLYNWYAAVDERNVCPTGWHVPSDDEWTELTDFLGGEGVAGEKLKATGTEFWQEPNFAANDESGFSALPGGWRLSFGPFNFNGENCYFWTSTSLTTNNKWYRRMSFNTGIVSRDFSDPKLGMSIRCVRD